MSVTVESEVRTSTVSDAAAFWRLWAIAAFAKVVSNGLAVPFTASKLVTIAVGLLAVAVVVDPRSRVSRTLLVASIPVSTFAESPLIGNLWVVAGMVSVAALIARPWRPDDEWWARFTPTARLVLLVFYSFAAFAKLNSGFVDPVTSCARFFANQSLGFWQLPEVGAGSPVATLLPWVTMAIELSVPLLLLNRRTRSVGVWLAVAFHLVLTADLRQHFFDFTLMLLPLFLLFAPVGTLSRLDARLPRSQLAGGRIWIAGGALMVMAANTPGPVTMKVLTLVAVWGLWLGLAVILVRALVFRNPFAQLGHAADHLSIRPTSFGATVLIAIVLFNGITPYLELKTSSGFNMYANLTTAGGESNHFIVRSTASMRDEQVATATILSTSDEDLAEYIDSGFALPLVNLRDYLAGHPDVAVSFALNEPNEGEVIVDLERAADHREWLDRQPWYTEKLLAFRAVPIDESPACQNSFLPAL